MRLEDSIEPLALGAIVSLFCACSAFGAVPPLQKFVSPEVHSDRTVTFRVRATKATEVLLTGGWMKLIRSTWFAD